jgi:hypothetical protein
MLLIIKCRVSIKIIKESNPGMTPRVL